MMGEHSDHDSPPVLRTSFCRHPPHGTLASGCRANSNGKTALYPADRFDPVLRLLHLLRLLPFPCGGHRQLTPSRCWSRGSDLNQRPGQMALSKVRYVHSAFSILRIGSHNKEGVSSSTGASFAIMDRWNGSLATSPGSATEETTDAQDVRDHHRSRPCPARRRWMRLEERVHEDGSGRRGPLQRARRRAHASQARARRRG